MESQPITVTSHLGRFAVVTVGRIDNLDDIVAGLLKEKIHFAELSGSTINPTEVVSILINKGETFKEGIENVYKKVKGSCSFLILTDSCIYAARDKFGRTPVIMGKPMACPTPESGIPAAKSAFSLSRFAIAAPQR